MSTVVVTLNGDRHEVPEGTTLGALVDELSPRGRSGVAVALDGEVVRRAGWDDRRLTDGDRIEVVAAVQGG